MFVAKLPGSMYATAATNAGPTSASIGRRAAGDGWHFGDHRITLEHVCLPAAIRPAVPTMVCSHRLERSFAVHWADPAQTRPVRAAVRRMDRYLRNGPRRSQDGI